MTKQFDDRRLLRRTQLAAASGIVAMALATAPAYAEDRSKKPKPTLTYFLPRTDLKVAISQRLVSCPADGGDAVVETTITLTPDRAADQAARVVLDAGGGVFAKRTVKLELNSDQTLSAFNSTAEGQGGPILKSIAKLAFKVAASAAGGVGVAAAGTGAPLLACTADVTQTFTNLDKLNERITDLEKLIAEGKGNPASTALLADWRTRRSQLRESLTLTTDSTITVIAGPATSVSELKPPDYSRWFTPVGKTKRISDLLKPTALPGAFGFRISVTPDTDNPDLQTAASKSYGTTDAPYKHLVYRRPVGATIVVQPCASVWDPSERCKELTSHAGQDATMRSRATLMQLSKDIILPVGKGGLFGTRQAAAKFDAQGAPVMLEYGAASGAADAAGVVDTLGEGLDTLRDAETEALKRAIAKEEARNKLNELREAAADPE